MKMVKLLPVMWLYEVMHVSKCGVGFITSQQIFVTTSGKQQNRVSHFILTGHNTNIWNAHKNVTHLHIFLRTCWSCHSDSFTPFLALRSLSFFCLIHTPTSVYIHRLLCLCCWQQRMWTLASLMNLSEKQAGDLSWHMHTHPYTQMLSKCHVV